METIRELGYSPLFDAKEKFYKIKEEQIENLIFGVYIILQSGMVDFVWIAALILLLISAKIRDTSIRKYLMAWVPKDEEQVILTEKAIEQGFYNKFWGEFFYTFKVRYRDIVRMEYDENQCLLRVYGPREERHWMDSDKGHCVNKFPVDYENESEGWIEIPTYFENFEGLKKELEEKSGKVIENKSRPFFKYK